MRITGGLFCNRRLTVPGHGVRPTQDRVRAALFSALGPEIVEGAAVLDLFAGSGALGLEALSRGAALVCWVERSQPVFRTLARNVAEIAGDLMPSCILVRKEVCAFLKSGGTGSPFDIVLADPPYAESASDARTFHGACFRLLDGRILKKDGLFVIEHSIRRKIPAPAGWNIWKSKSYGQTQITVFRRESDGIRP